MSKVWKSFVFVTVAMVVMSAGIALTACKTNNDESSNLVVLSGGKISTDLANYTADLSGAQQIGITTWDNIKELTSISGTKTSYALSVNDHEKSNDRARNRKDDELVMVKLDSDGEMLEIEYEAEEESIIKGGKITAGDIDLEIYKMHIFGEFTAVSYISTFWRTLPDEAYNTEYPYNINYKLESGEELQCWATLDENGSLTKKSWSIAWDDQNKFGSAVINNKVGTIIYDLASWSTSDLSGYYDFDMYGYENNDFYKNYFIHNKTGKVYSFEEIPWYMIENGFLVELSSWPNYYYYDLSVAGDGNLALRTIAPSEDVEIRGMFKDAEGWIYVDTGMNWYSEKDDENKTIFYGSFLSNYHLASNGKVYLMDWVYLDIEVNRPLFSDSINSGMYVPVKVMINGVPCDISADDNFDWLAIGSWIRYDTKGQFMRQGIYYSQDMNMSWVVAANELGNPANEQLNFFGYDCVTNQYIYFFIKDVPVYSGSIYQPAAYIHLSALNPHYMLLFQGNTLYCFLLSEYIPGNDALSVIECEVLLPNAAFVTDFVYKGMTSTVTKEYEIVLGVDGKPIAVEYSTKTYESKMIVLEPLN